MCNTLWRFKFPLCENSFPQTSQLNHLRSSSVPREAIYIYISVIISLDNYPCYCWSSMCNTLCRFKFPLCENSFPQTSQLNHLRSSSVPREAIYIYISVIISLDNYPCYCWSSMCNTLCRFKFPLCENSFPQTSQLKGFSPVWHRRCRARIAGETQIFLQMSHLSGVFDLNSSGIFSKLSGFIPETKNMDVTKEKDILLNLCILMDFPTVASPTPQYAISDNNYTEIDYKLFTLWHTVNTGLAPVDFPIHNDK